MTHLSQLRSASLKLKCKLHVINRTNLQGFQLLERKYGMRHYEIALKRLKSHNLSYVCGVGDKPLLGENVGYFIDRSVELFAEREAIVDVQQNLRRNFTQYKQDIDQFAIGLLSLKLNRGDRFGIWCPNRYEWTVAQLAAVKAGLIMVPLNPSYQILEMEYSLKKLELRALLMQESFRKQNYYEIMTNVVPEIASTKPGSKIKSTKHPYFDTLIMLTEKELPGVVKYEDINRAGGSTEKQKLEELQSKIQCDDIAMILFTSGTTGLPKGTILTHHNVTNSAYIMENKLKHYESIIMCCPIPLFHAFGCLILMMNTVVCGISIVLPAEGYDAAKILKAIEKERCTGIGGSPTMFIDLLHHPDLAKTDLSSLQRAIIGAAPCPPVLRKEIEEKLHCTQCYLGYGTTEIAGGLFLTFPDYGSEEDKINTCGWIFDYMECKIIDANGCIVPIGTIGEICARGYKVMLGYWKDEEKTKEVLTRDGWYKTGDLGVLHENGTLSVTGRLKEMILRGGANVYPREIEDFLMTHPKIADAQVVGVPDERLGEQVCAWIVLRPGQVMTKAELQEYCKGKVAYSKIPYYVRFVAEMPKTLTGKVQKYIIREEMVKMLSLK